MHHYNNNSQQQASSNNTNNSTYYNYGNGLGNGNGYSNYVSSNSAVFNRLQSTNAHLLRHGKDERVFLVGHLGYDSTFEEDGQTDYEAALMDPNCIDHDEDGTRLRANFVQYLERENLSYLLNGPLNLQQQQQSNYYTVHNRHQNHGMPFAAATSTTTASATASGGAPSASSSLISTLLSMPIGSLSVSGNAPTLPAAPITSSKSQPNVATRNQSSSAVSQTSKVSRNNLHFQQQYATAANIKRKRVEQWVELAALRELPIRQLSAGGYHVAALMDNGDVYCLGWNKLGQLGTGDQLNRLIPVRIRFPWELDNLLLRERQARLQQYSTNAASNSAGAASISVANNGCTSNTCCSKIHNHVKLDMYNNAPPCVTQMNTQPLSTLLLGTNNTSTTLLTTSTTTTSAASTASGNPFLECSVFHDANSSKLMSTTNGNVDGVSSAIINNGACCCCNGNCSNHSMNTACSGGTNYNNYIKVVKVKGGGRHTIVLTNDGRIWTFGCGEDGRLGHATTKDCNIAKEVKALRGYRVTFIDSAFWHTIVATECKRVFVFGHGEEGKLGLGANTSQMVPVELECMRGLTVKSASGGAWHSIILVEDDEVSDGSSSSSNNNNNNNSSNTKKTRVFTMGSAFWGQLGVNIKNSGVEVDSSSIVTLNNQKPVLSVSRDAVYTPVEVLELRHKGIIKVIAGSNFNVCLASDGSVYTFGCGSSGKTGHGSHATVYMPRKIEMLVKNNIRIKDIATGSNHTLLLSESGALYTFGWCRYGQLGHGDTEEISEPKLVEALKHIPIEQMTAGAFFTMVATRKSTAGDKPVIFNLQKFTRVVKTSSVRRNSQKEAQQADYYVADNNCFADVIVHNSR